MNEKQFTLATDYAGEDPLGWIMSEKLDGCRAYWDGNVFWTRGGEVINAPSWFTKGLPEDHLDGEIYAGRGNLQLARCATQYGGKHFTRELRFMVFDCPRRRGTWTDRMYSVSQIIPRARHAAPVGFTACASYQHLFTHLQAIQSQGGEGVMLRNPSVTRYEIGRTANLLKVKAAHPAMFL